MKAHIESGGGSYRHICGLVEKPVENYMSFRATAEGRVILPRGRAMGQFAMGQLTISAEHVGALDYGEEPLSLCHICHDGLKKRAEK